MPIICDTHILLFDALAPQKLSRRAAAAVGQGEEERQLACCDITLWEIAMLIAKQRIRVDCAPERFMERLIQARRLTVLPVTPAIAALSQSDFLSHGDPADRLIAATALVHRSTLITADEHLRNCPQLQTLW
ncbi:MAG: type II toxin-antitoxin system VapC family toxin [Sulfuricellaceae bacterium]